MNETKHSEWHVELWKRVLAYENRRHGSNASVIKSDIDSMKSSLLQRIVDGKDVYRIPPPLSYSYPCYRYVEEEGPFELVTDDANVLPKDLPKRQGNIAAIFGAKKQIIIDQSPWNVIDTDGDDLIVSYGEWRDHGFLWRISLDLVPAAESVRFRIARFAGGRLTSLSQLREDERLRLEENRRLSALSLDDALVEEEKARIRNDAGAKGGASNLLVVFFEQRIQHSKNEIERRRSAGLPDLVTDEEIAKVVDERVKDLMERDMSFDEAGNLFWRIHRLRRIAPRGEVPEELILDISTC